MLGDCVVVMKDDVDAAVVVVVSIFWKGRYNTRPINAVPIT